MTEPIELLDMCMRSMLLAMSALAAAVAALVKVRRIERRDSQSRRQSPGGARGE